MCLIYFKSARSALLLWCLTLFRLSWTQSRSPQQWLAAVLAQ